MDAVDLIDAPLLRLACPENTTDALATWVDPIKLGCARFGIADAHEVSALLAQAGHESEGFTHLSENLNYSAQRMAEVWPFRFAVNPRAQVKQPNSIALGLAHNPEALANNVYANRLGNGDADSGDGWRFRGQGPFQLTGRSNQQAFAAAVGMEFDAVPDYLGTLNGGAMSMCWFFKTHGLANLAETPGCADETRAVNGGLIGLADRTQRFNAVLHELQARGAA